MFVNSEGQLFIFARKNENGESVAGSENEILGACAASPDTFSSTRSNVSHAKGGSEDGLFGDQSDDPTRYAEFTACSVSNRLRVVVCP
jgi:hypothetical protein